MAGRARGVTLIELVLVIAMVGALAAVSSMYIKEIFNLWNFASFRNELLVPARISMIRMGREMRQVANETSVFTATANRFRFNDSSSVTIDYSLSGTNLMRNTKILAQGVNNFTLAYFDKNNQPLPSPLVLPNKTDIHSMNVTLGIKSGDQSKNFTIVVYPRNLGG
jgi:prepilin-type N-terminal cleavage/methylation domain-containing protein